MHKPLRLPAAAIAEVFPAPAAVSAEEAYPGYGYQPTAGDHIGENEYSPYLNIGYPQRGFWGDTHLHTSYSTDAGVIGTRLRPEEAHRFACGETVVSSTGVRAGPQRPLDFLVVADHAENLGLAPVIAEKSAELLKLDLGKKIAQLVSDDKCDEAYKTWGHTLNPRQDPLKGQEAMTRNRWQRLTEAAEQFNEPGRFKALIGYAWTSSLDGRNLHRKFIFRDGKDEVDQVIRFFNCDSSDPEDLLAWMQAYEEKTGGQEQVRGASR